ncbi:MAG: Eco57I restriction-modification methylase domain-containing protein [Bacteroidales bacterium]|nr:Eco57I restriction-modification methylase domain-containing protein [Bacteroidales bacterium]
MLREVTETTLSFVETMPKTQRKEYGQFFTPELTARFMADLFVIDLALPVIRILDAGAGTGMLSAAIVERILNMGYNGHISLVCYENDKKVLPILLQNLTEIRKGRNLDFEIKTDNYLTTTSREDEFDYIIGNPPYKKIGKDDAEAKAFPHVCHGTPNLYFLFWAKAIETLKENQELVYIIPRSWTSGAYFAKFREYLFSNCIIAHIHLFSSRDKVFGSESVLQETIIVKIKKTTEHPETVRITSSSTSEFTDIREFQAPYNVVVASNQYIFLVTDEQESTILNKLSHLNETLTSINHPMKTGIIVDFRTRDVLRDKPSEKTFPLFYSQHIRNGRVEWPVGKEYEYISTNRSGFLQENTNYLLVKRFTAKEERRRLQCGIYLQSDHPEYAHISTQNKVNYIKCETPELAYGLYVLFNSTIYDTYYRILNGSTQVNSTEINNMPVPDTDTIIDMGNQLMGQELTEHNCNTIIEQWIN